MKIISQYPQITRVATGLYTFDRAFLNDIGELGFPMHGCEIFGVSHVGKSTFTYSLAGKIASYFDNRGIAICDFEGLDERFVAKIVGSSGFDGTLEFLRAHNDSKQLEMLIDRMMDDSFCVGILDSIAAISPISEQEGSLEEANMGRRAFLLNQFSRKMIKEFRETEAPKALFMINHWYPVLGARGWDSPGGEGKKYLATIRIHLSREKTHSDGSYILKGSIYKNRWGISMRDDKRPEFYVYILSAGGIHAGMTAVYECSKFGLVKVNKGIVTYNSKKISLKELRELARQGEDEPFNEFFSLLEENSDTVTRDIRKHDGEVDSDSLEPEE